MTMRILVAEDSILFRRILVDSLSQWDYEVGEAENGSEAWQLYRNGEFQLVLTDWMMPEMDGIELTKRIRAYEATPFTYVILLTAKSDKQDLIQAMDAGADDFLIKPCDSDELRVRVREGERIIRLEQTLASQNLQLRETQAALVQSEKLASLGQLAAGMAHEINNPISYVTNNLAILRRDVTSLLELIAKYTSARDALATIQPDISSELAELEDECDLDWIMNSVPRVFESSMDGLSRVREIVKNLRDFARLDEAELDECDLNAAIQSTVSVLNHEIESKRLTVDVELQDDLPPVLCHQAKIHQVLYNLLLNAIQASPRKGVITFRTSSHEPDGAAIEISDQGEGIDPDHLARIYEPFFTTKPVGQGTGMGLAITYGVVRDHGGTIDVESELNGGTTFRICLPRNTIVGHENQSP